MSARGSGERGAIVADAVSILVVGGLLAAGVAVSLVATRLRLPALVLFLGLGMAIGSDGLGWIDFEDYALARLIGTVALLLILFEGGMSTGLPALRSVLRPAVSLAVVGTLVTAAITGAAAAVLLDLPALEAFLLGAVLSGTDGAAVFALLRSSPLTPRLTHTLEGEAGLNDPIAVLLVLAAIELIQDPAYGAVDIAVFLVQQLGLGLVVGALVGGLAVAVLRRVPAEAGGLHLVASLATAALAYGAAGAVHGSGFLAVYLAGLLVGSTPLPAERRMHAFHQGLGVVAEIVLFLTLGLLVFPSQLGEVAIEGALLAVVVAFIARPLAAFIATAIDRFTPAERVVLGWAGLRGAVPVVLATFPVIEGVPGSLAFFNAVFFAVVVSTLIQGSTVGPLAARLGCTRRRGPSSGLTAIGGPGAQPQPRLAPGDTRYRRETARLEAASLESVTFVDEPPPAPENEGLGPPQWSRSPERWPRPEIAASCLGGRAPIPGGC